MICEIGGDVVNVIMADDMPIGMQEHIYKNNDDSYTIKLNAKYDQETLQNAFEHAVKHLRDDDWEKDNVQRIEADAHGLTEPMPVLPKWLIDLIEKVATKLYIQEEINEYIAMRQRITNKYRIREGSTWGVATPVYLDLERLW